MPNHSRPYRGAKDLEIRLREMQRDSQDLKRFSRCSRSRERCFRSPCPTRGVSRCRSRSGGNRNTTRQRRRILRVASSSSSDSVASVNIQENAELSDRDQDYGSDGSVEIGREGM